MQYYLHNSKLIKAAEERLLASPPKHLILIERIFCAVLSIAFIISLIGHQYIAACLFIFIELLYIRGGTWKGINRLLLRSKKQWAATISLENHQILLYDGENKPIRSIRYDEIFRIERRAMRESIQPLRAGRNHPIRELFPFICLYLDVRRIPDNACAEDYLEDPGLILFPFHQSAWNILSEKLPELTKEAFPSDAN